MQLLDKKSSLSADSSNNRGLGIVFIITFKQTPSSILISSPSPHGGKNRSWQSSVILLKGHGTNVSALKLSTVPFDPPTTIVRSSG